MVDFNYRLDNKKLEAVNGLFVDAILHGDLINAIKTNTLIHAELFERYKEATNFEQWVNQFGGKEYDIMAVKAIRNKTVLRDSLIACEGASRRLATKYFLDDEAGWN